MSKKRIFSALLILVLIFAMAAVPAAADKSNVPIDATHLSPDDCDIMEPHFHEKIELPEGEELTIPEDFSDLEPIDATHLSPDDCPLLVPHFHEVIDSTNEKVQTGANDAELELLRATMCPCGGSFTIIERVDVWGARINNCIYGVNLCRDYASEKFEDYFCNICRKRGNRILIAVGRFCPGTGHYRYL